MKPRRVMLDGVLIGTNLTGAIDVMDSEVQTVKDILVRCKTCHHLGGSDIEVTVTRKSGVVLSLRRHKMTKQFYLNMSGNPLTFLKGTNEYGYAEADRQIITAYRVCLEMVEEETGLMFPLRLKAAIADRDIHMNSIEFACYTKPLKDKAGMMDAWRYIYRTADSNGQGEHTPLLDLLDLKLEIKNKKHKSSVPLKIMSRDGGELVAMLQIYDKALALEAQKMEVKSDIKNRLRLDLSLNYGWFRRHAVNKKKLKTLKDLVAYVENKGGWVAFLKQEFEWALDRTCLFHMWEFEAQPILDETYERGQAGYKDLSWEVYFAMLDARSRRQVLDRERLAYHRGDDRPQRAKISYKAGPFLELDMSAVDHE